MVLDLADQADQVLDKNTDSRHSASSDNKGLDTPAALDTALVHSVPC